jgi:hypothetical protein
MAATGASRAERRPLATATSDVITAEDHAVVVGRDGAGTPDPAGRRPRATAGVRCRTLITPPRYGGLHHRMALWPRFVHGRRPARTSGNEIVADSNGYPRSRCAVERTPPNPQPHHEPHHRSTTVSSTTIHTRTWNMWGHCERCDRWFEQPTDRDVEWTCPSCGVRPLHIENRGMAATSSHRTRPRH